MIVYVPDNLRSQISIIFTTYWKFFQECMIDIIDVSLAVKISVNGEQEGTCM